MLSLEPLILDKGVSRCSVVPRENDLLITKAPNVLRVDRWHVAPDV